MSALSEANGTFAIHLLKLLCQSNPSKNVCYSPVSISSALAMVLLGAKGQSEVQISQALSLNKVKDIHRGFQLLLKKLNKPDRKYSLRVANRLFADKTCEVLKTFKESCLQFYDSEMEQLSFDEAAEESRQYINSWVSKQTEAHLEILTSLNNMFYVMCMSAQDEKRPVQMMHQEGMFKLGYVEEVPARLLEMPYEGMELSLVVLLPDEDVDLSKVENDLTFEKLTAWTKPDIMWAKEVNIFLPKFKLQEEYEMNSVLQRLGMMDVFEEAKADLPGMSPEKNLFLSKVVHKSVVEVNEEGTEAAASAAVTRVRHSFHGSSWFCADHPFLFFIKHNNTNSILFCGRFSSP
ncbi:serpin B9-like [Mastomys coucha]|uniref:serpin B9-like n=1 Tax=Mastomys coucha TaxID=35658 RepID=UPI001262339A|nr:serpin B9-like [Mastomys coucha]